MAVSGSARVLICEPKAETAWSDHSGTNPDWPQRYAGGNRTSFPPA